VKRFSGILLLVSVAGCGGRTVTGGPPIKEDSPRPPVDSGVGEWGVLPDRGVPLDWSIPYDWPWIPDVPWILDVPMPPPPPCSKTIGTPCHSASDCCGGLTCVPLDTGVKLCTRKCVPDDTTTPLINEDDCPELAKHVCAKLDVIGPTVCLKKCTPALGKATCPKGVACNPVSNQWAGDVTEAVCAHPACTSGKDCPVVLSEACNTTNPGTICTASPPGAFCATDPGSVTGTCALPGVCDLASGLCGPHKLGKATAKVGDPCKDDRDCGGSMRCDQQSGSGTAVHARNGYCFIEGCAFGSTLPSRLCPPLSVCQHLHPGGRCYRLCNLNTASDCRGNPADQHGDYECYSWNQLAVGGQVIAKSPTCEPADLTPCTLFGTTNLDCSYLGLPGNPTKMSCRDRTTGAVLPKKSPGGLCLDDTASGK
jgi:hypothetical protein